MEEAPVSGYIDRIEVNNFKSYKGQHTIGPFRGFTAVIGPNGSGKSNVMDAISFVLGIDAKKLRGATLGDLVHDGGRGGAKSESAFVRMIFIDNSGAEHEFTRSLRMQRHQDGTGSWKSAYTYNGTTDQKAYESALAELGVSAIVPNCLVFQGEVESVARKSPKELTALFEQISGSDRFKAEYERLLREREAAKDDAKFLDKKYQGLKAEQREYKDQKKEADAHHQLASQLSELKRRSLLFQLFYLAQDIDSLSKELKAKRVEEASVSVRLLEGESKLPTLRQNHALKARDYESHDRRLKAHEKTLERLRPELLVKENELTHLKRKLATLRKEVEECERMKAQTEAKRAQLERELEELDAAEAEFRRESESAAALTMKQMSESELKEFAQLKEKARTQTSVQRVQLASLQREQDSDVSLFEELHKPRLHDLEERLRVLEQEELPTAKRRLDALEEVVRVTTSEMATYDKERQAIQAENAEVMREKAKCEEELESLQEELKKVRVDMSENERASRMEDCLSAMRRLFNGVHGRILDLVEPSQDRYRTALSVALGANMDAIVVADKSTAIQCIQYMKEQRIGVATFIPLDSIRTNVSYDKLRLLEPGVVKPIIDVLKYDSAYKAAMEYVCGNTLICADLDKAREWAFGHGERYKVVTFDGMLISKSGFMTGGVVGRDARAQRWDAKKVTELKNKRDVELARLTELNSAFRNVARERELQALYATLDAKLTAAKVDRDLARQSKESIEKNMKETKKKLDATRISYNQLQQAIDSRIPQLEALKTEIAAAEDELFQPFAQKVGIPNLREYEEARKVTLKALAERGLVFKTQRARIRNLLEYATQHEDGAELDRLQKSVADSESRIQVLVKEIDAQKLDIQSKTEEINALKSEAEELRKELETADRALKDALRDTESRKTLQQAMIKWIESKEASLQQLKAKRHQVLESAKADDITLPGLTPPDELTRGAGKRARQRRGTQEEEGEEEVPEESRMELDQPALKATQSMSTLEIEERNKTEDELEVDFNALEKEYKQCKTHAQREERLAGIIADIQSTSAKLENIAPNYKAMERLDVVGDSLGRIEQEIEAAEEKAQELKERYLRVREQRNKIFKVAFEQINEHINAVYKALTGGFGQAHLESHVDEPYAHPITYSLAPKSKAFTDIQHLSGGEQSVAALALLFAIQTIRPSPFFVLDEVDAALDADNVGVVAEYFKARSQQIQFIIISLKDKCFEKADALVGIYVDRANGTSRTLTLDLNAMCGGPYQPLP